MNTDNMLRLVCTNRAAAAGHVTTADALRLQRLQAMARALDTALAAVSRFALMAQSDSALEAAEADLLLATVAGAANAAWRRARRAEAEAEAEAEHDHCLMTSAPLDTGGRRVAGPGGRDGTRRGA